MFFAEDYFCTKSYSVVACVGGSTIPKEGSLGRYHALHVVLFAAAKNLNRRGELASADDRLTAVSAALRTLKGTTREELTSQLEEHGCRVTSDVVDEGLFRASEASPLLPLAMAVIELLSRPETGSEFGLREGIIKSLAQMFGAYSTP